jgi:hypothetical protein
MDLIQHANVLPWSVGAAFFIQMAGQILRAVGVLAIVGLGYAVVYRLLSTHYLTWPMDEALPRGIEAGGKSSDDRICGFPNNHCIEEDVYDEA